MRADLKQKEYTPKANIQLIRLRAMHYYTKNKYNYFLIKYRVEDAQHSFCAATAQKGDTDPLHTQDNALAGGAADFSTCHKEKISVYLYKSSNCSMNASTPLPHAPGQFDLPVGAGRHAALSSTVAGAIPESLCTL